MNTAIKFVVAFAIMLCLLSNISAAPKKQPAPKNKSAKKRTAPDPRASKTPLSPSKYQPQAGSGKKDLLWLEEIVWNPQSDRIAAVLSKEPKKPPRPQPQHIRIWDVSQTDEVAIKKLSAPDLAIDPAHDSYIAAMLFSPSGKKIFTGSYDWTFKVWDAATGDLIKSQEFEYRPARIHLAPSGEAVVISPIIAGNDTKHTHLHVIPLVDEIPQWERAAVVRHGETIANISFRPGSNNMLVTSRSLLQELNLARGAIVQKTPVKDLQYALFVNNANPPVQMRKYWYDPAIQLLAADGTSASLSVSTGKTAHDLIKTAFSPDNRRIASLYDPTSTAGRRNLKVNVSKGYPMNVIVWDAPFVSSKVIANYHQGQEISGLDFLDHNTIITCGFDGHVMTRNLNTGAMKKIYTAPPGRKCVELVVSPDRQKAAVKVGDPRSTLDLDIIILSLKR